MKNLVDLKPIFLFARNNAPEVVVHGGAWFRHEGHEDKDESSAVPVVGRSLLKPWQILALGDLRDAPYFAMALASHSGESKHLDALQRFMVEHRIVLTDLHCPAAYPMDDASRWRLELAEKPKSALYHPCIGKHIAMVAACKRLAIDPIGYHEASHQLQKRILQDISSKLGYQPEALPDSCGVPTMALPAKDYLRLAEGLCRAENASTVLLRKLWMENPFLVGGTGRLDTFIMTHAGGMALAKEGADGLLLVQSMPSTGEAAQGCLIKISSGYNRNYLGLALYSLLKKRQSVLNRCMQRILAGLEAKLPEWIPPTQQLIEL